MTEDSTTIRVHKRRYFKLEDMKDEIFNTQPASFDAVVDELIEEYESDE